MKTLFASLLLLISIMSIGQSQPNYYCITFEDTSYYHHLSIDSSQPNNLWQIGRVLKPSVDTSYFKHVIITDTINPYSVNSHSSFVISRQATAGDIFGFSMFTANYFVETDSLKDFGRLEFSPDKGNTWIDLINDTTYASSIIWYSPKPALTGRSISHKYFEVLLTDNASVFHIQMGDTLLYRFTFISDSIYDGLSGLMFDDICFSDFVEGISEIHFQPIKSKIYPNPTADRFTIDFENPGGDRFQLAVYNIHSKLILTNDNITDSKINISTNSFVPGMFVYKLTNLKDRKRCWGKFLVTR